MNKALLVSLHVQQPSIVELTVAEPSVMERLTATPSGFLPARCGELLIPGSTTLTLECGLYVFETRTEAQVQVIDGAVHTVTSERPDRPPTRVPRASGQVFTTFSGDTLSDGTVID